MAIDPKAKATAAAFRKQISKKFPGVKISVRLRQSSWMTIMEIEWVDGPSKKEVEAIAFPLRESKFNQQNDDCWDKIEGVDTGIDMVKTDRRLGAELRAKISKFIEATFDGWRFSHKAEFIEATAHLWQNPKTRAEIECNDMALAALTRWVADGSTLIPGLAAMWEDCADF